MAGTLMELEKAIKDLKGVFKKDYIVGLDIGSSSIKIVRFRMLEDGLHLVKVDLKEIRPTSTGALREQEIETLLKDAFRGIDIRKSKIIVSINCPTTSIKKVITPYMPKWELQEGLRLEAKNYFPFPVEDSLLNFEITSELVEKEAKKYEVIAATSPKKTIQSYLSLLEKAGIKPASFIPTPYALQKLASYSYSKEGKTLCFIDIGECQTELIIFKGKNLVFSRKVPVAGRDFTEAMTEVLVSDRGRIELTFKEAEKIKREIGIPSGGESRIIDDKISTMQVLSMLRTPLEQLLNEIDRSFDYYREETGGEKVDELILFGGGASLGGLVKFLSEGLDIEVKIGDPLEGLKVEREAVPEREKVSYRLAVAIGAALTEARGINLLPPEIREETKRVFRRGTIEVIVTAVVLIAFLVYMGMRIKLTNFRKRISVAKLELSSLQPQLKKTEAYHLANIVLVDEPHWEDIFKELSNLIPEDIYLTNINMEGKIIAMEGIIVTEDGEQLLSDFILRLGKGIFKNVKLVRTEDLGEKLGNQFKLECWVD